MLLNTLFSSTLSLCSSNGRACIFIF
jgi:hypothetical protein